jgi:hypothetical protein
MSNEFADPELQRALGEMTLNFALLEAALSLALVALCEIDQPAISFALIWTQKTRYKIDTLAEVARFQGGRYPGFGAVYHDQEIKGLCRELYAVNDLRNSITHGYWTVESGPLETVSGADPLEPGFEARAQVIRPVVEKFGRNPNSVQRHFPMDALPGLTARIGELLPRLSRLMNDFCRVKRGAS